MILSIMAEVRGYGSGAKVDAFAQYAVTDVAEVTHIGIGEEDGIFKFDCLTDVTIISDRSAAAEITIRSNFTVFADDDVAFDKDAWQDLRSYSYNNAGVFTHLNSRVSVPFCYAGEDCRLDVEKFPRVLDGELLSELLFPLLE